MTSPPQPDPISTAQDLTAALTAVSQRLDAAKQASEERDKVLEEYGHGNRRRIWLSWALIAVDVILTVVTIWFAIQAHDASSTANRTRASNLAACVQTNAARAQNKQLWDYLLAESRPAPNATAAQKAADVKLLGQLAQHVNMAFASAPCEKLYGVNGG